MAFREVENPADVCSVQIGVMTTPTMKAILKAKAKAEDTSLSKLAHLALLEKYGSEAA